MRYKIISFYSEPEPNSTYYTDNYKRFVKECDSLELDYYVEELESKKDYWLNCKMKPEFIQSCMQKFNMPLIWLDIDSIIRKKPTLEKLEKIDFGAVKKNDSILFYGHCLFFNNSESSLEIINQWKEKVENPKKHRGDHFYLIDVIEGGNFNWSYMEDFTKFKLTPKSIIKSKK